jgi:TonB-linked SusC/RagA family outer membrane protein
MRKCKFRNFLKIGRDVSSKDIPRAFLLFFLFSALCFVTPLGAQNRQITGTVFDAGSEEPLIGVSVVIKGTPRGTVTDLNGQFTIEVTAGSVLEFSYIGYIKQEVNVGNQTNIEVSLQENAKLLDEVVVVGFGTQKKVNLTGAVGVATAKELQDRPVTLASQALQGLVPGLNISQNNGSLDSRANITIRGRGTLNSDLVKGDPLILIDGIEGDINALNPNDIDNISVLKDAAASSIYGSKAPFGVVLITTKKGEAGKTKVNYSNNFHWNKPILLPEFMDSYTFALYYNDAGTNGGGAHFNNSWLQAIKDYKDGKITTAAVPKNNGRWEDGFDPNGPGGVGGIDNRDYYKELIRSSAFSQEHNLTFSGGNDKITFFTSFNFLDQNGLMVYNQDAYNRYSVNAKMGYEINKWSKLAYSNRFVRNTYDRPSKMTNDIFKTIGRQAWPVLPLYDGNDNLFEWKALDLRDGGNDRATTDNSYQQVQLTIEPIKNWKTFVEVNYSTLNYNRHWHSMPIYQYDVNNNPVLYSAASGGNVHEEADKEDLFGMNIYSEYSFTLANKHNLKGLIGLQEQSMSQTKFGLQRNGVIFPDLPEVDLTNGMDNDGKAVVPSVNGERNKWSTRGLFGRINYDYDGKYLAEANLRYDASSRYREGHRSVWSPSFSVGWNIARESFMESANDYVSMLKLRASYGQLANQNTSSWYPTYKNLGLYSGAGAWLQDSKKPNIATSPGEIENQYMTWEEIVSVNFGVDYGFFNNRLTGSLDYYTRTTSNSIGPAPTLPAILGVDPKKSNETELRDYGFELQIGWQDRLANGLNYGVKFLLSDYQTEVTKYPGNKTEKIGDYYPGKSVGEIWGYTTVGIAKTQDEMDKHIAAVGGQTAISGSAFGEGDIMYANIDGVAGVGPGARTLSDHGDLSVIGNTTPRYQFGIDINAEWKGIDLRMFFQGVMKRDYWQGNYFFWGATSGGDDDTGRGDNYQDGGMWNSTGLVPHLDYFRDENTTSVKNGEMSANLNAYYPKPYFNSGKNRKVQSGYLQDASYIRLKNLQVGYTLPKIWTMKAGIEKARIFFSGENLWTGTNMMEVFDPESIDGGWNGSVYPLSAVYSFGININF